MNSNIVKIIVFCFFWFGRGYAQESSKDFVSDLSLDALLSMDVTSISKKSERMQHAAASIYVITEEDIRRSGAKRIQDLFAMVPGLWIMDVTYDIPGMSIRSGSTAYPSTVNVLMDGVPITNPILGIDMALRY